MVLSPGGVSWAGPGRVKLGQAARSRAGLGRSQSRRARRLPAVVALAGLVSAMILAACGGDDSTGQSAPGGAGSAGPVAGSITVFAAASLTDAFGRLGKDFKAAHPGVKVTFNFAGSASLREQILAGAPADVFASANEANMTPVVGAGVVSGSPTPFVTNQLEIAVPSGNPGKVTGLADFANSKLLIGLCAPEMPCGEFGREALSKAGIEPSVDTNETDVRSLLTKLEAGELDAGIVYRTDVQAAGDQVNGIEIPADDNVTAVYPIVRLSASGNPSTADAFVQYVRSAQGQATLRGFGFGPPT
jgi:molybdate transport system substrate-binding protein